MRILVVGEGPTDCGRYKDNQWVDKAGVAMGRQV